MTKTLNSVLYYDKIFSDVCYRILQGSNSPYLTGVTTDLLQFI